MLVIPLHLKHDFPVRGIFVYSSTFSTMIFENIWEFLLCIIRSNFNKNLKLLSVKHTQLINMSKSATLICDPSTAETASRKRKKKFERNSKHPSLYIHTNHSQNHKKFRPVNVWIRLWCYIMWLRLVVRLSNYQYSTSTATDIHKE